MGEILDLSDSDFTSQMHGLVHEAERALEDKTPGATPAAGASPQQKEEAEREIERRVAEKAQRSFQSLPEVLKPLAQGLQAVGRATGEHTQILTQLQKALDTSTQSEAVLPGIVTELKGLVLERNAVSRQMFDALHQELKTYKDGFLLESVHRPMIRDLITLYDDLSQIQSQMSETVAFASALPAESTAQTECLTRMGSIDLHLQHNLEFILEVLARLEVTVLPVTGDRLDKHTQRAVAVEVAEDPDQDMTIVRTLKIGFLWKDRVIRPQEVVIRKWKEGFLMALHTTPE